MLIDAEAFQMLDNFVQQVPCHEEEQFLCGLYAQLEQAWVTGGPSIKGRVAELIKQTMPQVKPRHRCSQE